MATVADDGTFPEVDGRSLDGTSYELPRDFDGGLNLVLVAFRRDQQADVDTWVPTARRLEDDYPDLRYYELPVIDRLYVPVRPFIDGGMRGGVHDDLARRRTITLYLNVTAFRRSLDLPTEDAIYALLVDRDGEVHWGTDGRRTDADERALEEVLDDRLEPR
ncbi:MAG: hypothetical protein ACI9YT_002403 [Halobacteriales archaeon]|jgi:hypothetical protein